MAKRTGKWVSGERLVYHGKKLPSDYKTRMSRTRVEYALRPEGEGLDGAPDDPYNPPRLPRNHSIKNAKGFTEFHAGEALIARWRDADNPRLRGWLVQHLDLLEASLDLSRLYLQSVNVGKISANKGAPAVTAKARARKSAIDALRNALEFDGPLTDEEVAETIADRNPELGTKGSILKVL